MVVLKVLTFKEIIIGYEQSLSSRSLAKQTKFFWSFFYTNCLQGKPFGAFSVKYTFLFLILRFFRGIYNTVIYGIVKLNNESIKGLFLLSIVYKVIIKF